MSEIEVECPACGQPWVVSTNSPFWQEAQFRAGGRAHTPGQRSEEARTIPGNLCGVCGAPLPRSKSGKKRGESDVVVAYTEKVADAADLPTVLPAGDERIDRRPAGRRRRSHPRPSDSRTPVLSPFVWILVAVGAISLVLVPLSLVFFPAAYLLMMVGFATGVVGMVWSWKYYMEADYEMPSVPIRLLGGPIARFIYHGLHALQDPMGIGRPFLLEVIGVLLILIGLFPGTITRIVPFSAFSSPAKPGAVSTPTLRQPPPMIPQGPPPPPFRQPPPPPPREVPPATKWPGLLAYWSFDEGQGIEAMDSSGKGLRARLVNAAWTDGVRGKALSLTGPGSYLDYGDSPRLSSPARAPFTLAFWTRTTRPQGTLLSQRNSQSGVVVLDILVRNGRAQAQVRQDGDEVSGAAVIDGGAVNDFGWHHLALIRADDCVELFLDGASQGRSGGDVTRGGITTNLRALGSERYWVTKNIAPGDPHFQGAMDEFCIFDRALRADEIVTLAGR